MDTTTTTQADVAQTAELSICNREVVGSIPTAASTLRTSLRTSKELLEFVQKSTIHLKSAAGIKSSPKVRGKVVYTIPVAASKDSVLAAKQEKYRALQPPAAAPATPEKILHPEVLLSSHPVPAVAVNRPAPVPSPDRKPPKFVI
jgi:hypothetical protein